MSKKLPSIPRIKKALYADWALRVKKRDGFKCLLCGATENLTAHHWYVCDHHAHAARYCVDNGATLCYACHIRGVHQRADWASVRLIADATRLTKDFDERRILLARETELTTEVLRNLWQGLRERPVDLGNMNVLVALKRGKLFVSTDADHPVAVVGNTMRVPGYGVCEVVSTAKDGSKGALRYTVKPLEDDK